MESIIQFMNVISLIIAIPMIIIGAICFVKGGRVYGFFIMILGCYNLYNGIPAITEQLKEKQYITGIEAEGFHDCIPLSKFKDTYIDDFLYVYYKTCSTGEVKQINVKEYTELNTPTNELINESPSTQKIIEKNKIDILMDSLIMLFVVIIVFFGVLWCGLKMIRQ